ncbi:hypothetical protein EFV12PHI1_RNA23 [Enterococcus phage EfV12-phi1]|uniref:RNA polymerase sigma-70 region 4 domain-containing protein n=1 Tax=Enterococcus phage EfV12-phi1 TaxID=2315766 RepID=A0A3B8DJY0_9CAUD|nr:hypothetical protein HOU42_gp092 [Enterococcus phage EfV12-phi1]AYJ73551.1 hypothetical protein EFV12PHI1_RNA23 [Enterococcus phage EfV12-phi1]
MYDMVTKKKRNQAIVRMRQAGRTFKDIASEYNISQQRVQQIYKRETSLNKIRLKLVDQESTKLMRNEQTLVLLQ